MILTIYLLGAINLAIIIGCYSAISHSAPATFEGFGTAVLALGSVGVSGLLTILGFLSTFSEIQKKRFTLRAILATLLAAAPLVVYYFMDVLPRSKSSQQHMLRHRPAR